MDLSKTDSQLTDIVEQDSPNKKLTDSGTGGTATTTITTRNVLVKQNLRVTTAPRIDISRASSSSQHDDSRDSSPENVFDQVGTGTLQETSNDVGFKEDGTTDLRSSTEELCCNDGGGGNQAKEKVEDVQQVH